MANPPWAEKYSPKSIAEFAGNADAAARVKKWVLEWGRSRAQTPLCLHGPTGVGKTALAVAAAAEMGNGALFFSAYDSQDSEKWLKSLKGALSGAGLFGSPLVILEAVGTWQKAGSRGLMSEVAQALSECRVPAILTADDWYDRTLMPLRTIAEPVPLKSVNVSDIRAVLEKISAAEGLKLPEETIKLIAGNASGDLRAAINDMQSGGTSSSRERSMQIFQKVRMAIRSVSYKASRTMQIGAIAERDMLKMYVAENLPAEIPSPEARARAFSRLSRADIFDGRIMRRQYWGYLRYSSDLMVWGVSSERVAGGPAFAAYAFPSYIQKMGASRGRRAIFKSIAKKISLRTHTTTNTARAYFPLMSAQFESPSLSAFYGFDEEEMAAISLLSKGAAPAKPKAKKAPSKKSPSP